MVEQTSHRIVFEQRRRECYILFIQISVGIFQKDKTTSDTQIDGKKNKESLNQSPVQTTLFIACRAKNYYFKSFHFTFDKSSIEKAGMQVFLEKTVHTHKDLH